MRRRRFTNPLKFVLWCALTVALFNSCATTDDEEKLLEETPEPAVEIAPGATDVSVFQIVSLTRPKGGLKAKYTATFGDKSLELMKTSDTTLVFIVPDVASGEHTLDFELSQVKFKVITSKVTDPDKVVASLFDNFDAQLGAIGEASDEDIAEAQQFKDEVAALFNSLSAEEKRQAILFYEANKASFLAFAESVDMNLDAATTMRLKSQSECPDTDYMSFYGCSAENLGTSALELVRSSRDALGFVGLGIVAAELSPASFGLGATGALLAWGTAVYLIKVEVKPQFIKFRRSLGAFMEASWILVDVELFEELQMEFTDGYSTSLRLRPAFRSMRWSDGIINSGSEKLIKALDTLWEQWQGLKTFLGELPNFRDRSEPTTLDTEDVGISNISNPNVKYIQHEGQEVKFESRSGEPEEFTYHLRVSKEGFTHIVEAYGAVVPFDSVAYYESILQGNWVMTFEGNATEQNHYTFNNEYFIGQWVGGITSAGQAYTTDEKIGKISSWEVFKSVDGKYCVRFVLPNRGWSTSAWIKEVGVLVHRNTFNI